MPIDLNGHKLDVGILFQHTKILSQLKSTLALFGRTALKTNQVLTNT